MYSATGPVVPRSQPPREPASGQAPGSQYPTSAVYSQQPSISHQLPTPSEPSFPPQGLPQQAAAPGAFASNDNISITHPPSHLYPSNQRARSSSPGQSGPPSSGTQDLRRSHSLNETMSNPQAGYYPMATATPMGAYQQHQIYNQGAMSQSGYYAAVPQSPVSLAPGYMGEARQDMPGMNYGYASMPYSQSSYPPNYATSYAGNSSAIPPSYGSPIASQQYPRAGQPAALAGAQVQVVDRAKKPQCWDHGCNGREFSTFSNLLRHQREKSGTAQKSYCPHCGAEFTRTTARNGHMEHGKCKTRRTATGSSS